MQILGLDIGDKTVGVAKSDPLGYTAQPMTTIRYTQSAQACKKLAQIIAEYSITRVIAGLPLNMNGTEGPQAKKVRAFVDGIRQASKRMNLAVEFEFWDERMSTMGAERSLIEADVSRAKRKQVIDKMAAVFILQGYLDSLK
ncbi:MAG: Holliday junction resolvase RuvX [Deltaproteobacteria bacterium]|nr:Holliday junction resolvase RuvX [Deltaproteobacteria bacterium]